MTQRAGNKQGTAVIEMTEEQIERLIAAMESWSHETRELWEAVRCLDDTMKDQMRQMNTRLKHIHEAVDDEEKEWRAKNRKKDAGD